MRRQILLGVDVALLCFATTIAFVLRENFELSLPKVLAFLVYLGSTFVVSLVLVQVAGLNASIWRFSSPNDYTRVALVVLGVCVGAVVLTFSLNRLENVARSLPFLQGIIGAMMLIGARAFHRWHHTLREQRKASAPLQSKDKASEISVLVVGLNRLAETYVHAVGEIGSGRTKVVGFVAGSDRHVGRVVATFPVLGVPEDIEAVIDSLDVHGVSVDRIVVAAPFAKLSAEAQQALLRIERSTSISLQFLTEALGLEDRQSSVASTDTSYVSQSYSSYEIKSRDLEACLERRFWRVKRVMDAVGALAFIILLSPVFLIVSLLVAGSLGLPVLFWQRRPGLNGVPFHLYKFRSMGSAYASDGRRVSDAERVSQIGTFLRRTRLDELPQLYSILIGDMSFVGPRPLLPRDQPAGCAARLAVRPGLTGWAQVIGGRDIPPDDKAALDVWYVRNASLFLDLQIVVRTFGVVIFGERISHSLIESARNELAGSGAPEEPEYRLQSQFHVATPKI
jgi:lipopolysaccharide/colanic/teichoic acid biosynthesis glycosyltransferase